MDYETYLGQFGQLEADIQAAEASLRAAAGDVSEHLSAVDALLQRYRALSRALSQHPYLHNNMHLQVVESRVLMTLMRLNAAVFRRAARQH